MLSQRSAMYSVSPRHCDLGSCGTQESVCITPHSSDSGSSLRLKLGVCVCVSMHVHTCACICVLVFLCVCVLHQLVPVPCLEEKDEKTLRGH